MIEALSLPFFQRAFIACLLVGYLASFFGVFIVQRGLSFMGSGLAHAAFGGVTLGLLLNTEPLYVAIPFTIMVSVGITWVREKTILSADTAIGIFFSVSVSLGVIFLSIKKGYTAWAFNFLFGSILSVKESDIYISLVLVLLSFFTYPLWGHWAYATFDRELSLSDRLPVLWEDYLLSGIIAVIIVVSVKIIGIILIAAFLVIPAASGRLVSSTFLAMTIWSVIIGVFSSWSGLVISYVTDLPSGATIILVQAIFFFLLLAFSLVKKKGLSRKVIL